MHLKPIAFVHIEKTAGTSLRKMLDAHIRQDRVLRLDIRDPVARPEFEKEVKSGKLGGKDLADIDLVHGHYWAWLCDLFPCRPVTLLRDPVEMLASFYDYSRNELALVEAHREEAFVSNALTMPFPAFVETLPTNALCRRFGHGGYGAPAVDLEAAKRTLDRMIFGISEHFERSAHHIFAELVLPAGASVKTNVTRGRGVVSAEQRRAIERRNAEDCALYEWALQEFLKRSPALPTD